MRREKHPFKLETEDWQNVNNILEPEQQDLAILPINPSTIENGTIQQLDQEELYIGPLNGLRGEFIVLPPQIAQGLYKADNVEPGTKMGPENRNVAEFYTGSIQNSPVEIKFDKNLPDSEPYHSHNVYEAYAPVNGEIDLGLFSNVNNTGLVEETVEDGEVFVVPPYVQHKLIEKYGDPNLAVFRYADNPTDEIAKFDLNGENQYDWVDVDEEEYQVNAYDEENPIRIRPDRVA